MRRNDICEVFGAGTMFFVYMIGSIVCRILSWMVVWTLTAVCFVIGLVGVTVKAFDRVIYYSLVAFEWIFESSHEFIAAMRPKVRTQMVYLVDFRNDILHDCGRGDMYGFEDEF